MKIFLVIRFISSFDFYPLLAPVCVMTMGPLWILRSQNCKTFKVKCHIFMLNGNSILSCLSGLLKPSQVFPSPLPTSNPPPPPPNPELWSPFPLVFWMVTKVQAWGESLIFLIPSGTNFLGLRVCNAVQRGAAGFLLEEFQPEATLQGARQALQPQIQHFVAIGPSNTFKLRALSWCVTQRAELHQGQ